MKDFITLLFFFVFTSTFSQTVQPCVVMEYNERLKKTPLGNVVLKVKNAGAALSNGKGECTLRFRTLKPGDRVEYSQGNIVRDGYEVFNKDALEQWTLSGNQSTFRIVMCRSDRFKRICDNYQTAMSVNYRKQRDREIEEIKKLKKELDRERSDYHSAIAELDSCIRKVQEDYDKLEQEIAKQADKFARIDLSEMNAIEAEALELMQSGDIEGAIRMYESLNLVGKKSQNLDSRNAAYHGITQMWEAINEYRMENKRINESLKRQIEIYMAKGDKVNRHKADSTFRVAAYADTTDIKLLEDFWRHASKRNMNEDEQNVANIIYNYYVREFENSPKEGVCKRFDGKDKALSWVRDHKLSVECLTKDENTDSLYEFTIYSKDNFCSDIIRWMDRSTSSVGEKKKVLADIMAVCKENEDVSVMKKALRELLTLTESTERWAIIQNLIDYNDIEDNLYYFYSIGRFSGIYGESELISSALEVVSAKEVEDFLRSVEKKRKKEFQIAKKKINEVKKTYLQTSPFKSLAEIRDKHIHDVLREIDGSIRHWYSHMNNSGEWDRFTFTDSLDNAVESIPAEKFLRARREICKVICRAEAYESIIFALWKLFEMTGSTKKLDSFEKEILRLYEFQKQLTSSPDVIPLHEFVWYYSGKGDIKRSRVYQRLYAEDDVIVAEFLNKGDTLSAIKHKIDLAGRAKPVDSYDYMDKLEDVCDLCIRSKDYAMAESYALQALEVAETTRSNWHKTLIYDKLSTIYKRTQQWEKAIAAKKKIMGEKTHTGVNFAIAKLYWENLQDAPHALEHLQKELDNYDQEFEESSTSPVLNGMSYSYGNIISYMRKVYITSNTGTEYEWIEVLKRQLRTYDSLIQYQEYVEDNNAHFLRSMIISSYANLQDSAACMEFLDERAERIKAIYDEHPTKSMLYAYADAAAYDYYHFYDLLGNLEKTEYYALKAIDFYKQVYEYYAKLEPLANMYRMLVLLYETQNDYEKVTEYCELALPLYEQLKKYDHIVAYLYIAHAWANYIMFPKNKDLYAEPLKMGCKYDETLKYYKNSDIVKKRIKVMQTPIDSLLSKLRSYDDQNNYEGYDDWRHEIHQLRSSIISFYLATDNEGACRAFLDERAADILQKRESDNSQTMLYVCADAVGYDYYSYYRQAGDKENAEKYALIAIDIYEYIYRTYKNAAPLQNMYRELWGLFKNDKNKALYYENKYREVSK